MGLGKPWAGEERLVESGFGVSRDFGVVVLEERKRGRERKV